MVGWFLEIVVQDHDLCFWQASAGNVYVVQENGGSPVVCEIGSYLHQAIRVFTWTC
jgi:hypothetical protein